MAENKYLVPHNVWGLGTACLSISGPVSVLAPVRWQSRCSVLTVVTGLSNLFPGCVLCLLAGLSSLPAAGWKPPCAHSMAACFPLIVKMQRHQRVVIHSEGVSIYNNFGSNSVYWITFVTLATLQCGRSLPRVCVRRQDYWGSPRGWPPQWFGVKNICSSSLSAEL